MIPLNGYPQHYKWGSKTRIPQFLTEPLPQDCAGKEIAELWFGAHPLGASTIGDNTGGETGETLMKKISDDPDRWLGPSTRFSFGDQLPYLVKLIAPGAPLSLQVHPTIAQAQNGFLREEAARIPLTDPKRTYRDANHKPEMLFALTDFVALVGFAVRRQVRERLEGLQSPLAGKISRRLLLSTARGMKSIVAWLLDPDTAPSEAQIQELAADCADRLKRDDSPNVLLDQIIVQLADSFPGDPGIAVAILMNPVLLHPGEALFVEPGTLHAYQSGLALEVMANSDNVIRAGLTEKHIDREQLVEISSFDAHPPTRLAPEHPSPEIDLFYAPVEDFELSVVRLHDEEVAMGAAGPRILICLDGKVQVETRENDVKLQRGQAVFISDQEGPALLMGAGAVAQCAVP